MSAPSPAFLNRVILDDLRLRLEVREDLLEWIEKVAQSLANTAGSSCGWVDLNRAASIRGILELHSTEVAGHSRIDWTPGGFVVSYRDGLDVRVARFAIAHEIGHTYWFRPGHGTMPLSPYQLAMHSDQTIEFLCNRLGAALLMPRSECVRWLAEMGATLGDPRLDLVPKVARYFGVPELAAAHRLFHDLSQRDMAIACVERNEHGGSARWCALPYSHISAKGLTGVALPLRYGRKIPAAMMPAASSGKTTLMPLDGRWWEATRPQPRALTRKPLKAFPIAPPRRGLVAAVGSRLYLGLPL